VAGVGADRLERPVERRPADRIEDDVEALAVRVRGYVLGDRGGVADGGGAEALDDRQAAGRPGREDLGAAGEGQLDGDVPDAAGASRLASQDPDVDLYPAR
jgi:hypothetical protein